MKRLLTGFLLLALFSCNSESGTEETAKTPANKHGFTPGYSFSFVMDDPKHSENALALWRDWETGNLSNTRHHFADSLAIYGSDGSEFIGPTDTILATMQAYRNSFPSMRVVVDAVTSLKSTDTGESWALIWGSEYFTDQNGKQDSTRLHELWRFNKEGKTDLMFQYSRPAAPPPAPAQ